MMLFFFVFFFVGFIIFCKKNKTEKINKKNIRREENIQIERRTDECMTKNRETVNKGSGREGIKGTRGYRRLVFYKTKQVKHSSRQRALRHHY